MDLAKTTARQNEKQQILGIWCNLYLFDIWRYIPGAYTLILHFTVGDMQSNIYDVN